MRLRVVRRRQVRVLEPFVALLHHCLWLNTGISSLHRPECLGALGKLGNSAAIFVYRGRFLRVSFDTSNGLGKEKRPMGFPKRDGKGGRTVTTVKVFQINQCRERLLGTAATDRRWETSSRNNRDRSPG
jgi:hypothetical protein